MAYRYPLPLSTSWTCHSPNGAGFSSRCTLQPGGVITFKCLAMTILFDGDAGNEARFRDAVRHRYIMTREKVSEDSEDPQVVFQQVGRPGRG